MTTQSIIVYRNPLEQAMWEGAMGAEMIPISAGIFTMFAMLFLITNFLERRRSGPFIRRWITFILFGPSILAGILVMNWLWI